MGGGRVISDVVQNILGFVPLGILLHFRMRPDAKDMGRKWAWATGIAAIVSLLIETIQLFLPARVSSLADVLSNTFGGGLGFWIAWVVAYRPWIVHLRPHRRTLTLVGLAFYIVSLISFFIWAAPPQTLKGWDRSYPLLIGNETTLDRPWLGKIYFVALYPRVLRTEEIKAQFQAGLHFNLDVHLKDAPIAVYAFQEMGGTRIHDHSPVGVPLDLEIAGPGNIMWIPEGGLQLFRPTLVRSAKGAEKIAQRFIEANAFSVAAWFEPKDDLQTGPARIVSLSQSLLVRDFYLGQEKSEIYFRVRNRVAGPNGTWVYLKTMGLGLRGQPIHVVAIYDHGTEQLYANGILIQRIEMGGGLALIARELKIDPTSRWQSGLLVLMLLGPLLCPWVWLTDFRKH